MKFAYAKPKTLAEAMGLVTDTGKIFYMAGGTDLMVKIKSNLLKPELLVEISHFDELKGIEEKDGVIRVGALTTHTEMWKSPLIKQKAYVLAEAAHNMAAPQIRNVGTVGGNVCNASPAGDTIPALLVLDADVSLYSQDGTSTMKLNDFLFMPAKTKIQPRQIVHDFTFKPLKAGEGAAFIKVGVRKALAISVANGAAMLRLKGKTIEEARVAVGSVAVKTIRLPEVEKLLVGKEVFETLFAEAGQLASDLVKPIGDIRGSAEYRKDMVNTIVKRALTGAAERAAKGA